MQTASAEKIEAERKLTQASAAVKGMGRTDWSVFYEYGWVDVGSRSEAWRVSTGRLSYFGEREVPYLEARRLERGREVDTTLDAGCYFKLDDAVLHAEAGGGMGVDYVYRFQALLEYERKLQGTLFWKVGGRYLDYAAGEVYQVSPGLAYYFGDHSVAADYNVSFTEGRGDAHFVTLRANFRINERLSASAGIAVGQRLYDASELDASDQGGFIVFGGPEYRISESITLKLGLSYSEERPDFKKTGVTAGISMRF